MADETTTPTDERSIYELAFHIDPTLSETESEKTFNEIKEAVITTGGELITESSLRRIDLAYTISRKGESGRRDFTQSLFGWIGYEGTPEKQAEIEEALADIKPLFRNLIITTTKEVLEFAKQREEEERSVAQAKDSDGDEVSEDELDEALESATI